jgi:hypothetical protein
MHWTRHVRKIIQEQNRTGAGEGTSDTWTGRLAYGRPVLSRPLFGSPELLSARSHVHSA